MTRTARVLAVIALVASGAIVAVALPASAAPTGFAVDAEGDNLYSIDLATGATTLIGAVGFTDVQGLTLACDGTLYGIDDDDDVLLRIDTTTGAGTQVGTGLGSSPVDGGLTFGADGRMWMTDETGNFYQVDPTTGVATLIGGMGGSVSPTGLTGATDGTIYTYDRQAVNGGQLLIVNTSTAATTAVGTGTVTDLNLVGLDFDTAGVLWGVNAFGDKITFTINTTTGVASFVANYNAAFQLTNLAIAPVGCAVSPQPALTARFTG